MKTAVIKIQLIAFAGFFLLSTVGHCGDIKIDLLSKVSVSEGPVFLSSIASFKCSSSLSDLLRELEICKPPIPGSSRLISREYISLLLGQKGISASRITFSGAKACEIRRKCNIVTPDQLIETAKTAMRSAFESKGLIAEIEATRTPNPITIAEGNLSLEVDSSRIRIAPGMQSVVVLVKVNGRIESKAAVSMDVRLFGKVAVLNQTVRQFDAVTEYSIDWEHKDISRIPNAITSERALENTRFKRTLSAGTVLTADMVETVPDVTKGSPVTIRVRTKSVILTTMGNAVEDGRIGRTIRVKGPFGRDELRAVVVSPSVVELRI